MIDVKDIVREIMCVKIEHLNGDISDNIAVMLCSFFEESSSNPKNGEKDIYDIWDQWSVDQYDLLESEIVKLLEKHLC